METRTETKGTIMKKVASLMAALGAMALFGAQPNQVTVKNGDTLKDTYTDTTLIIPAGAGQGTLLCRMTFDDKSNPLKVEGAADAVVRKGQTEKVAGLGEVKWLNEGGDGAVAIPKNYHIALPIPDVLTKAPGRAWTMVMKFKIDTLSDYGVLLNMPASNTDGCLLYVNQNDARLAVKQHDKRPGCAFYGESGFVAGKIHTLKMCFDTNKTTAFLDGRQIFTRDCTLAGSHADCAKAGGAFLIRGDDDGEGGTVTFYEVSVYEGAGEAIAYIPGNYLVVDLSGGPNASSYPVSKLDGMPSGGWSDVYKTTKLVLREIPAGRFTMGSPKDEAGRAEKEVQREVTLTKPFYLGVFEVTQKQYELVMGEKPSWSRGDTRPVEHMHPSKMRGDWKKYDWPANRSVDPDSFIGRLRAKTGIDAFDLPTDAQWEYACRAGTATALYSGKNITGTDTCPNVAELARYRNNIEKGEGGCKDRHTVVGTYAPNAWGLYDMLGNVWEYCLDWYVDIAPGSVTDPEGPESGPARVTRGGSWYDIARWCRAAARNCDTRYDGWDNFGFRIACTGSVSAKTATPDETSASLPGGLVAHWPLDGNANDASGNGNHGKVEGATLTADRNGKANAAYHFDGGKRDTIRVPSSPSLKSVTAASTVAAWIKPDRWDGGWIIVFSKGDETRQYGLFADSARTLYMNDSYVRDSLNVSARLPDNLKLGVWQHVAVTYDGSKAVAYLNGRPGEVKSTNGTFVPNDEDFFFGRDYQGGDENYWGDIDDVRIYNRALSASEVAALAGTWSGGTQVTTSPTTGGGSDVHDVGPEPTGPDAGPTLSVPTIGPHKITCFLWRYVKNGGKNLGWDLPLAKYRRKAVTTGLEAIYATHNTKEFLSQTQLRLDAKMIVPPELAGTWTFSLAYDDYMYVVLDGKCCASNLTYTSVAKGSVNLAAGEHDLAIVCGDTWGGYGTTTCGQESAILVSVNDRAPVPLSHLFVTSKSSRDNVSGTVWRYAANNGKRGDCNEEIGHYRTVGGTPGLDAIYAAHNKKEFLSRNQLRLDGWFDVTKATSGKWEFTVAYDDYMSFGLDGVWLVHNPTFTEKRKAHISDLKPGRYWFTVVCGDTLGGYGVPTCGQPSAIMVSINGATAVPFEDIVKESTAKGWNGEKGTGKTETGNGGTPGATSPTTGGGTATPTTSQPGSASQPGRWRNMTIRIPGGEQMMFVWCPPGTYMMGRPENSPCKEYTSDVYPQIKVTLTKGFWLGQYEVTQAQWKSVMGTNPSAPEAIGDDLPVNNVSWTDAMAFAEKIGYGARLPTEAEWEYSCKAAKDRLFHWGETCNGTEANCKGTVPYGTNQPGPNIGHVVKVGSYQPNAWGFYDMAGNVSEWCSDLHTSYTSPHPAELTDPKGATSSFFEYRTIRGGCFRWEAIGCRSVMRDSLSPDTKDAAVGFRLALAEDADKWKSPHNPNGDPKETGNDPQGTGSGGTQGTTDSTEDGGGETRKPGCYYPGSDPGTLLQKPGDSANPATGGGSGNPATGGGSGNPATGGGSANPTTDGGSANPAAGGGSGSKPTSQAASGKTKTITLPGGEKMQMVWCSPGTYMMGPAPGDASKNVMEHPIKTTLTKGFWIGKYEVTQKQYSSVTGANPSDPQFHGDDIPVGNITWLLADEFCKKVGNGARLPTAAEWEYACRAGTTTAYPWGNACNGKEANCNGDIPCGTREPGPYLDKPVKGGSYQPNAWGIYDMIGNMMEWCSDWETSYGSSVTELVDPRGSSKPSGGRVVKGGSYFNDPGSCQSGYYTFYEPDLFVPEFGFRMAMDGNPDDGHDSGEWNATESGGQETGNGEEETDNGEVESENGKEEPESGEQDTEDGGQGSDFEFDPPGDDSDGPGKDTPKVGGLDEPEPGSGTKPEEEEPPPDEDDVGKVYSLEEPWNYDEDCERMQCEFDDEPVQDGDEYRGYWKRVGIRVFYEIPDKWEVADHKGDLRPVRKSFTVTPTSLKCRVEVPAGWRREKGGYTTEWATGSLEWSEPPLVVKDYLLSGLRPSNIRLRYKMAAHNVIERNDNYSGGTRWRWQDVQNLYLCTTSAKLPEGFDWSVANDPKKGEKLETVALRDFWKYGWRPDLGGHAYYDCDGTVTSPATCYSSEDLQEWGKQEFAESGLSKNVLYGVGHDKDEMHYTHILAHVGPVVSHVFYLWEYHPADEPEEEEKPKGGYWHLVSNNVERVEKSKLDNYRTAYARATEKEHMVREEYFKTKTDRSVSPPKTEKVKAAQFEFVSQCSRPPEIGRPGEKFTMRVKYSGVKNDILAEVDENLVNYETYMTFRQYGPMRKFSLEGDCYDESKLGASNRQKGLVAGVSTYPGKGLWAVPDSKMRLNLRDNTVWSVFPEGPEQADPGRWLEVSYWDQPAPGYGVFDIAKTTWYYEWVPEGAEPTEEPEAEPPEEEEEEEEEGEAMIKFTQENLSLPACKDKFVLGSKDEKKNKIAGKEEHRLPFVVLNTPTNLECKVTASLKRIGAAGENGKYLKADDITNAIPYAVEVVKDKELGQFGVYEAVVKEVGDYELAAGNVEGILLKVEAECGKKGDKDYVKVYETLPIYRIHLGLSLMLEANTIPCYWELSEKSKYKLDKQGIAGDPELDPNDEYVIRQEDFEVPMRDASLLLMLYDEERGFVRLPAVPTNVCVTATKVENARYCKTGDADMDHQAMVDALAIDAFSTGQKRDNRAHIIKFSPTKAVLDPPVRILADLSVDTVVGGKTYTAKKSVLLHSQPLRIIETIEDEEKYLAHDTHIRKQLERIMFKIEGTCLSRLFSLRNMIERMIDGYDYRFGFDEGQVKTVMKMYVDFMEGRFEGANGTPYKVTLGDDLKACYAFMEGLRDNTGFLGRMALGIISGGISEHVFTTMTILEKMQQEIYTCDDVNKFGFMAAFKIGAEELGKQVAMELVMQGAIQGVAKASNIDMAATMQMWSGRYRSAMDSVDGALKRNLSLYRAGDKALQGCKNFLGSSTRTAANAIESTAKSEKSAAARAEDLLKKSRQDLSPAELAEVAKYEKAMENGMNKVRKLQAAQQAMEEAAKGGSPAALKQAKIKYREAADMVWTDKCALKKLQDVKHPYADRMRAQFNNYRENLLDSVQREALGDIANELGCSRKDLYVMNASNGSKSAYLKGKKVPGDRDISYMQKVYSDRTKDLTIDQSLGQRAVARRLWKKMHNGAEPPSIEEAYAFMKSKDVTYVNPNGDASSYVFEHNLDGYEDLPGMVGMTKDGKINKNLLANDLHNPTINAASVKHKGMEWWGDTVKGKYKQAEALEKLAAKYKGSAKQKLLDQAMDLRYQAVGDACEGIRQITKQTDNIIIPRGLQRCGANPLPPHLQELQALGKRVGMDVSPTEFTKALQKHGLTLDTWADAVSKYVNVKAVPVNTNIDINLTGGKKVFEDAINRAKDKDKNKK